MESPAKNTAETGGTTLPPSAACPISFGACSALFMPSDEGVPAANAAVLIVSPWGFEEICLRKFHRQLADELSVRGISSLRFDFPGTGNSIGDTLEGSELEIWLESIHQATEALKKLSGCSDIILLGHGLGATLAATALPRLSGISGLALLAPALSGRLWVRETGLWWRLIAADLGISGAQPEDGALTVAGLTLLAATTKDIKALKLEASLIQEPRDILLVERLARDSDAALAEELAAAGNNVTRLTFEGHEALIANPVVQKIPSATIRHIAEAIQAKTTVAPSRTTLAVAESAVLEGSNFTETALRFGDNNRLYGVLCEPKGPRKGATVLIHGTSYDRSTGWGRSTVLTARSLAADGIATFRFDAANVGDSPPVAEENNQILYSSRQITDTKTAISLLIRKGLGPIVLSGRCSGSYAAFQTALQDERVSGLALVNNIVFVWDQTKTIDDELVEVARPLEDYSARARNPETLKRLFRGEIDIPSAAANMSKAIAKRLLSKIAPYLGPLLAANRHNVEIRRAFETLARRNLPIRLLYADNDVGLEELKLIFGPNVADEPPGKNVAFTIISDADHNMTPPHALEAMIDDVRKAALAFN